MDRAELNSVPAAVTVTVAKIEALRDPPELAYQELLQ